MSVEDSSIPQYENFLTKEIFPMTIALIAAKRSKDRETKVGACIVDDENRILGYGYNGHPFIKNNDSDKNFSWDKEDKHKYVCHAERNAIDFKTGSVHGATMFVTLYPCNECAKTIVQNKIKKLVYFDIKDSVNIKLPESRKILETSLEIPPMRFCDYLNDAVEKGLLEKEKAEKGMRFLNEIRSFLNDKINPKTVT